MTMNVPKKPDQYRVDTIHQAKMRSWTRTGAMLLEVDRTESWRGSASSFSAWIQDTASQIGVHPSVLWRDLGAARFYQSLGNEFDGLGLPPLSAIETETCAEHLELIEKISRVAPRTLTRSLLESAIQGNLTRAKLRETWQIYRDGTSEGNRRGRLPEGVNRPPIPRNRPSRPDLFIADALYQFNVAGPRWTGIADPAVYRVFVRPSIPLNLPPPMPRKETSFFIALVQDTRGGDLVFHNVDFTVTARPEYFFPKALRQKAMYFDFLWVALPIITRSGVDEAPALIKVLPRYVGLMQVDRNEVRVVRAAERIVSPDSKTGDLAKQLLAFEKQ